MAINFRICVTSLSDYNDGILYGAWIDFEDCVSADDVRDKINAMLVASPFAQEHELKADEWAIHDYELPGSLEAEEYSEIDELWDCYETLQELEDNEMEAFLTFFDFEGGKYPSHVNIANFREAYRGFYKSEEDFAEELVDECGYLSDMPETLRDYFDYEALARDLFMTDYRFVDGYVFSRYY